MTKKNSLVLVILLVLSIIITACSGSSGGRSDTAATDGKSSEQEQTKVEALELTIRSPIWSASPLGTPVMDKYLELLEGYMGIPLKITWEEPTWTEMLNAQATYIAAGDFPDIFFLRDKDDVIDVGDNGLLLNINDYRDYIPNYEVFLKSDPAGEKSITSSDTGAMYGFVDACISETTGTFYGYCLRFDILQKNNIKPPETMDELYEVCKQLKSLYPDSYPLTSYEANLPVYVMQWNHTSPYIFYDGTKYMHGPTQDTERFRKTLEWIVKMYKEGLIDPEYPVDTADQNFVKMLNGTNFFMVDMYSDQIKQRINENSEYPGVEWGFTRTPDNLFGETSWKLGSEKRGKYLVTNWNTCVSIKTKHPELVVKMVDYGKYSLDMINLVNWGIEGLTYNTVNGKKQFVDSIANAKAPQLEMAQYGLGVSCRSGIVLMPQLKAATSASIGKVPVYENGKYDYDYVFEFTERVGGEKSIDPVNMFGAPSLTFTMDEVNDNSVVMTPINTYVDESMAKFITGEWNINSDWDKFMSEMNNMGDIKSVVDLYNRKLAEFKAN